MLRIIIEIKTEEVDLAKENLDICPGCGKKHAETKIGVGGIGLKVEKENATETEVAVSMIIVDEMQKIMSGLSRSTIRGKPPGPAPDFPPGHSPN